MNRIYTSALIVIFIVSSAYGIFPINVLRPWDINLRPTGWRHKKINTFVYDECALRIQAFDTDRSHENALQIWTPRQDALAMLKGFPADSAYSSYLADTLLFAGDDGQRGNFKVHGHLSVKASAGLGLYYCLPYSIRIGINLPIYAIQLSKVRFEDLTINNNNAQNIRVRENLTNNFAQRLMQFDPSLSIEGWRRVGIGDIGLCAEWRQSFGQHKDYLRDVELSLRGILALPSGLKRNQDELFSIPFGYESTAFVWGGSIKLTWFDLIRGGLDLEFTNVLNAQGSYRIKVSPQQTDFLLLAKVNAHKEFGFTQRYHLSLETCPLIKGLSLGIAYEFCKHDRDKLELSTEQYSQKIANSAQSLQDWTMHQAIFKLRYDCLNDIDDKRMLCPQFLFFYKLPFNGKRSVMMHSIGAQLTLNF